MTKRGIQWGVITAALLATATAHAEDVNVEMASPNPNVTLNVVTGQAEAVACGAGGTVSASARSWEMVCVMPCAKALDRNARYFVSGDGVSDSKPFILPPANRVTLSVDAGPSTKRATLARAKDPSSGQAIRSRLAPNGIVF